MSLNLTSYDPQELKRSLIGFVQSKPEFSDIDYEGSAFNTIIDLLVRNTHYIAYMANMTATESFLDSAQLRANVVSHAQKLSYTPKSRTASTAIVNLKVTPASTQSKFIVTCNKGSSFINTIGNVSYSFTNQNDVTLVKAADGNYYADNVELKQGNLLRQRFLYSQNTKSIEIPNKDIDVSTMKVYIRSSLSDTEAVEYQRAENIIDVDTTSLVYYLFESTTGNYTMEFGKDVLGKNPDVGAIIDIEFVSVEKTHANGLKALIGATPIGGHSNITVTVKTEAYGGAERDTIERIKFLAPKVYEAQNRAVRDTDYETIMIREFPFIKSAKSWGGEKNSPPYYGKVFLCAIPQAGFVIADSVKTIIENRLSQFAVAGITPEIVDAEFIGLKLSVGILFDESQNNETFAQISSNLKQIIQKYNEDYLRTFDFWYNNSLLMKQINASLKSIYSIEIDKTAFINFTTKGGTRTLYSFDFINQVRPGSLLIENVIFDSNATNQSITDDSEGNIVAKYTKNGVQVADAIGTIDYQTGAVMFAAMILNSAENQVEVALEQDNFYTRRNKVVYIDTVEVMPLDDRRI